MAYLAVTDHISSVNDLEVNFIQKPHSMTDFDKLKGDLKIFPEELSNSICHRKDADPLQVEMEDYILELRGDGCPVVKESQTEVGFDDPLEMCPSEIRADMNNNVLSSADVSGMELEDIVSQECSIETDGSAVRDICIDEGVHANDKILEEDIADRCKCIGEDSNAAKDTNHGSDSVKVELGRSLLVGLNFMTIKATEKDFNSCESKILIHESESRSEMACLVSSDCQKDKVIDTVVAEDTSVEQCLPEISMESGCNDKQNILHRESVAEFQNATDELICSSSTSEATVKETADEGTVETSDMKIVAGQEATDNYALPTAIITNEVELPSNAFHPQIVDASQMPEQQNLTSDHLATSARIQRDHFDSSFASVGPYTNSIAYSGSVAFSGSFSHRSDASTVSTRSFAFPVLQNEWNFSPVRMQKADRRHLGRHRGWKNGLFCCKF